MKVSRSLDEVLARLPDCRLVAFIDLDASMVLATGSHSKPRQERLDALGALATRLLPLPDDPLAGCVAEDGAAPQPEVAVLLSTAETTAFVRSAAEPGEALCCSCSPNAPVDAIIEAARSVLPDIGAANQ